MPSGCTAKGCFRSVVRVEKIACSPRLIGRLLGFAHHVEELFFRLFNFRQDEFAVARTLIEVARKSERGGQGKRDEGQASRDLVAPETFGRLIDTVGRPCLNSGIVITCAFER